MYSCDSGLKGLCPNASFIGFHSSINFLADSENKVFENIPIATTNTVGGVKPDGRTINIDSEGVISVNDKITYGSSDLVAGESDLETGKFYFVYE